MIETIREHIDNLFAEAPKTRKAVDLKEEITQNTIEKYQDLLAEGYSQEDACQIVLDSIGDVTELFADLKESSSSTLSDGDRRKKATLRAVAVGLYLFAGAVFLSFQILDGIRFSTYIDLSMLSLVVTVLLCIPPTCMLVYAACMYPDFRRTEDTLVETYKEKAYLRSREKAVRSSVSSIIWLLTVTLYFIISFATFHWEVTWILFLVGGCMQAIAALIFSLRRDN